MRDVSPAKRRVKRRWWQVLLRVGGVVALLLGVLYVLLPWLLPAESIRRKLEDDLAAQLGVNVFVGPMTFRWDDGVVIDGLTVENPPGFDGEPMVRVGRIRCDFSPLRFLLRKRIAWMDVEKLVVTAEDNAAGRLNTDCLAGLKMDVDARRLRVRQSEVSVFLHDQPRPLVARISDLQVNRTGDDQGEVTMTGSVEQGGAPAPISLRMSVGGEDEHAATVDCRFCDLDLSQLPRSRAVWGDLPIESLQGRCGGQLVFAIDNNLRIEELRLELLAENLLVKPLHRAPLPKIEQAGLRLQADLDALSERADIRKFHLRLPGVRLAGSGVFYADCLRGEWEAIDSLHLRGTVYPDRLAMLMTGRESLPDGTILRGPVEFSLAARQQRDALQIDLDLDATETNIHSPSRLVKPTEQPLRLQIKTDVGYAKSYCPIRLERARLNLGKNTITAAGEIADASAFVVKNPADADETIETILEALKGVRLRGTMNLTEPLVLTQSWFDPPDSVELRGTWSGPWSFSPGARPRCNLALRSDAETVFRVKNVLEKPQNEELTLEVAAVIDPQNRSITDLLFDAMTETARISFDDINIQLSPKKQSLRCRGSFQIDRLEGFRQWMPDLDASWQASGCVKGTFGSEVRFAPAGKAEADAEVDLANLSFSLGEYFIKPAGDDAKLYFDTNTESGKCSDVGVTLGFKGATCLVRSSCLHGSESVDASVQIEDLAWLESSSPLLHRALQGGGIEGEVLASGGIVWDAGTLYYGFVAESEKLSCTVGGKSPIANLRDKHVTFKSKGMVGPDRKGTRRRWDLWATTLTVGGSSFAIPALKTQWNQKAFQQAAERGSVFDACEELTGEVRIITDTGDLLGEVFPKWTSWAGRHKLEGKIHTRGTLEMDDKTLSAKLNVDAGDIGVQDVEGFTKTKGTPVVATLDVSTPRDFSAPQVRRLTVETAGARLEAQVQGKIRLNEAGLPIAIDPTEAKVTTELTDATKFSKYFPALKGHKLAGVAQAKWHWSADESELGTISELTFNAEELRGEYRGKRCRLDGAVCVEGVSFVDEKTPCIERMVTDNLEFAAGDNHGWLLADAQLQPGAPSGTVHVLFESLDDKDLADWLREPKSTSNSAPTSRKTAGEALQNRADRLIAQLRDELKHADLTGRITAERYRTYDPNVRQFYPARDLELSFRWKDNELKLQYDAGLYGGMLSGTMETNLTLPDPLVVSRSEYRDVKATESIRPQISHQFPGNTVYGRFSRTENVHYSLRDLLGNIMDSRYRLCPEGTAKMIATDGVVVGQAAPDFVTKLFPGLNLTKYPYRTMTAFTKLLPDGATENETFFFGAYDLYMDGVTQRDYTIQYTVGLVMMGSAFPPESLRDWRQGRIPLLKVQGRIDDGKLVDDKVSYPLPNETLFEVFVKNNLFYRAWVNLQPAKR